MLPADHIDRQMFSSTHGATNRLVKGGSARKAGNDQTVSHRSPYIHVVTTSLLRMSGVGIVRRTVSLQPRLLSLDNRQDPWTLLIKVLQHPSCTACNKMAVLGVGGSPCRLLIHILFSDGNYETEKCYKGKKKAKKLNFDGEERELWYG